MVNQGRFLRYSMSVIAFICILSIQTTVTSPLSKTVCPPETRTACSPRLKHHCLPDENNLYKHICLQWKWIQGDIEHTTGDLWIVDTHSPLAPDPISVISRRRCAYYNSALRTIDSFPCDSKRVQGCPANLYQSHKLSGFDACYLTLYPYRTSTKNKTTIVEDQTTSAVGSSENEIRIVQRTRYETIDNYWYHALISGGASLVTVLCVVLVLNYYFERIAKQFGKGQRGLRLADMNLALESEGEQD